MIARLCVLALAAFALASCGGSGGSDEFPRVVTLGDSEIYAGILNTSVTVGENRLVIELADRADEPILGAEVHLRFFDLTGDDAVFTSETDTRFVAIERAYIDEQSPGKPRETTGTDGAYVAHAAFSRAGIWGMRVRVTRDGRAYDEFPFRFSVRERSDEPMLGESVPASVQATVAVVPSIEDIDSSYPPRPHMHDATIADAVSSRRPAVIAFATPAYCRSRLCAPVMDTVMDPLFATYGTEAAFIHVEPYELRDLRAGFVENPVPATREWQLRSEPWVFVIDRQGRVAAKFEGIMALEEVEAALLAALGQ